MNKIIAVLTLLALLGCAEDKPIQERNKSNDKDMLNLFKKKPIKTEVLALQDYNAIIEADTVAGIPIEKIELGKLKITSGNLVVCDPLTNPEAPKLSSSVAPGKYQVTLFVAKTEYSGDRNALALLKLGEEKAVKWIMALRDGDDISMLKDESEYFGFDVDAGVGAFMDAQAGVDYINFGREFMKQNPNGDIYNKFIAPEFKKGVPDAYDPSDIGVWANFQVPSSELNIIMFHSGFGDGAYPSYWGFSDEGTVVSLVIDFQVVDVSERE